MAYNPKEPKFIVKVLPTFVLNITSLGFSCIFPEILCAYADSSVAFRYTSSNLLCIVSDYK